MSEISKFKNIFQNNDGELTSIEEFLMDVKLGTWAQQAEQIQLIQDKTERNNKKQKTLPYVTISGKFNHRAKDDLVKHSGFICLDFDDLEDVEDAFNKVCRDHYTYAAFRSISGRGIAALVKIDGRKHLDAFLGLESYFANKYGYYMDRSCKDVSRARFVSYDPKLYTNTNSEKFALYLPKSETHIPKSKLPNVVTGQNDIDYIIQQINEHQIDITDSSYPRWLEIGFALSEEFGESGRKYYHSISYYSPKYDSDKCDKQYSHCLRHEGQGVNYATFLYHCKNANISIISPETKHVVTVAGIGKRSGRGLNEVINTIVEVDNIDEAIAKDITKKVFKREDLSDSNKLTKLESLEIFLNSYYNLKRNKITRFIENNGEEIDTNFLNTVYIKSRKEVDDKVKFEEIDRIIGSDFTPEYNPLREYLERKSEGIDPVGKIDALIDSVNTNTGMSQRNFFPQYKNIFFKKWLVGLVASIYGEHSPLLLVLTGGQGTGKTEFFRRLLPKELRGYYAESKLDAGKDDEILMTQKILILDDEFGGKSKLEAKRLKELTSKEYFDLREPYGRKNVKLKRMAVLCGTSNDESLLSDPTGNRRIIPLDVQEIDHQKYNNVDKKEMMVEAYKLYKSGFNWHLTKEEINALGENTTEFEQVRPEKELIQRFFKLPEFKKGSDKIEYLQSTEIKAYIELVSGQRLSAYKMGQELKLLGYSQDDREVNGVNRRVYKIIKVGEEDLSTVDDNRNPGLGF